MSIDWAQVVTAADKTAQARRRFDDAVNIERAARIEAGTDVTVTGLGSNPVKLQGRPIDMQNLAGLATMAQARMAASDTTTTVFRDRDNTEHTLTPAQVFEAWALGAGWVQAIYEASWTIKAGDIVEDIAGDERWP